MGEAWDEEWGERGEAARRAENGPDLGKGDRTDVSIATA
jgi:hypothetical protein